MAQAQDGDTVSVHYKGKLDDGMEFDSSEGREPLTFVVGQGQVIEGFDNAVRGLEEGESTSVRMEPEQAYGPRDPARVVEVPASAAPPGLTPGAQVQLQSGEVAVVTAVNDEVIEIDANHPLAGQALTFEIQLVAIA